MTDTPASDSDSMCSMSSTSVVSDRSYGVVIRCAMSWAEKPLYDQTTLTTGMLMFGKISVGVRMIASGPRMNKSTATTMNVYGRLKASLTIHINGVLAAVRQACIEGELPARLD